MSVKLALTLILVACVSSVRAAPTSGQGPSTAEQSEAVAHREAQLRQRIGAGLNALAERLENEASIGSGFISQVNSAPAADVPKIIEHARSRQSGISRLMNADAMESAEQPPTAAVAEVSRRVAAADVGDKVAELRKYAQHLRALHSTAESAPIDDVLHSLETAFVPDNVAVIAGPPGSPVPLPSDSLQPFADAGATTGLNEDLLPFVVGLGATTVDFPAVGAIQFVDPATGGLTVQCTGTLVAANVVLTAQHCLRAGDPQSVFFQHAGTFPVHLPPMRLDGFHFPEHDLMLLFLEKRVSGIMPIDLNDNTALPSSATGQIVGFGFHRPFSAPNEPPPAATAIVRKTGVKLYAQVTTNACDAQFSGRNLICWTFPAGPLGPLDGSTCYGDSGGPLLVFSDKWRIAGVTSGGNTCLPGDKAVDTEVFGYLKWIREGVASQPVALTADGTNLQALQPAVNARERFPVAVSERILDSTGTWDKTFSVTTEVNALRLAVNAVPSGTTLSLSVKNPNPDQKCDKRVDATAVICEFPYPPKGAWSIQIAGAPFQELQLVVTAF